MRLLLLSLSAAFSHWSYIRFHQNKITIIPLYMCQRVFPLAGTRKCLKFGPSQLSVSQCFLFSIIRFHQIKKNPHPPKPLYVSTRLACRWYMVKPLSWSVDATNLLLLSLNATFSSITHTKKNITLPNYYICINAFGSSLAHGKDLNPVHRCVSSLSALSQCYFLLLIIRSHKPSYPSSCFRLVIATPSLAFRRIPSTA